MRKAIPYILIIVTLLIGFGLGFITSGRMFDKRVERFVGMTRGEEGFKAFYYDVVDPTAEQKEQLDSILSDHFERMMQHRRVIREEMNRLQQALDPVLTDAQKEKLSKLRRLERNGPPAGVFPRSRPRREGPPPPSLGE